MLKFKLVPLLLWSTGFILVASIFYQLPLNTIVLKLSQLTFVQWCTWLSLNLAIITVATHRWLTLVKGLDLSIPFYQLLQIRQAGQAISFMTPGPQFGGEPLQIYWLWKQQNWPIHKALLAVGVDRFYELWINFGVLLMSVILLMTTSLSDITNSSTTLNWQALVLALLLILLSLSLLGGFILKHPQRLFVWLTRVTQYWQHHPRLVNLETHWQYFHIDLKRLITHRKSALLSAFMWSLIGWLGLIGELWLILSFFDLELSVSHFMMILVAMRLAFLLPLPGGIGTLEASLFWVFQTLALPLDAVVSVIAMMRLRDAITLLIGLGCVRAIK